ncbi:hypothetical protein [Actinorugispora endophytica]|uniref:hypothetical protein n=1 Tax=Actinorugispora endophytica TaxID=1605990 RepID=UPI001FB7BF0D|nr:hypothetical protein [Actinorugispora endophytica]
MTDEILDVDAPIPKGTALLVRFGDLGLERHDSFEPGFEVRHTGFLRLLGPRKGWIH